jgi:hypothetical protein
MEDKEVEIALGQAPGVPTTLPARCPHCGGVL